MQYIPYKSWALNSHILIMLFLKLSNKCKNRVPDTTLLATMLTDKAFIRCKRCIRYFKRDEPLYFFVFYIAA